MVDGGLMVTVVMVATVILVVVQAVDGGVLATPQPPR